ncbi:hypothetical protein Hanom_Chr15g01368701 [Helianthus anomalus]
MSSERCKSSKSCLICSSHVSLGRPLPLLPSTVRVSTTLTGAVVCLRFTCPNHLNLPSLILSEILATPNLSLKTSFLTRSELNGSKGSESKGPKSVFLINAHDFVNRLFGKYHNYQHAFIYYRNQKP